MTTREEKIAKITETIGQDRNVGNEYEGDFRIREVTIGDIMEWHGLYLGHHVDSYRMITETMGAVLSKRKDLRQSIKDQSDECIDYVYSLTESDK